MREYTGGDLIGPRVTRFASTFLPLQSIKDKKELKGLVYSTHWEENLKQASTTVLKIGLIGRLILFGDSPLNITLIALIMRSGD